MYVDKRCVPEGAELDSEKVAHGYCGVCGRRGTIWLVRGTEDSYKTKRQGVTFWVVAGAVEAHPVPKMTKEELEVELEAAGNTTDTPIDTGPEVELPEESEAIVEAPTEALEAIDTVMVDNTEEPEETPVEAVKQQEIGEAAILDAGGAVPTEQPPEAEPEPLGVVEPSDAKIDDPIPEGVEVVGGNPRITAKVLSELEEARKATIARLEAELAKLKN